MIDLGLSPVRTTLDMPIWSISVYHQYEQFSMCQRFISVYCQYVFLSGVCATTDVGQTFRREFPLVREVRTTAVSQRLRKTDWCFYSVFVFYTPNCINTPSSSSVQYPYSAASSSSLSAAHADCCPFSALVSVVLPSPTLWSVYCFFVLCAVAHNR